MPLQIQGPVSFVNGRAASPAAQALLDAGFDPNAGGGYGQFVAEYNARQAGGRQQRQGNQASILAALQQQLQQQQASAPSGDQAAQQAATDLNAAPPPTPPLSMMSGPIQSALGIRPTVELANRFKYNPPWRAI